MQLQSCYTTVIIIFSSSLDCGERLMDMFKNFFGFCFALISIKIVWIYYSFPSAEK